MTETKYTILRNDRVHVYFTGSITDSFRRVYPTSRPFFPVSTRGLTRRENFRKGNHSPVPHNA